jgi:predicted nucleic acid-binding protein
MRRAGGVVVDSSVLICLVKIGRLLILKELFQVVLITESVYEEVIIQGKRSGKDGISTIEKAISDRWIQMVTADTKQKHEAGKYRDKWGIGQGEAESIALSKSRSLPVILDDKNARHLARTMEVQYSGTAALLLRALRQGIIDKVTYFACLRDLGQVMWLSPDVMAELIRLAEEKEK